MVLETKRLILREYTPEDFSWLYEIISDPETMRHYPKPYDEAGTNRWIQWNLNNYREYGFGLWVMELKSTGEPIGDCGITMQRINGKMLPEIGYHLNKAYWRQGYGSEAAKAVRDWGFTNREFDSLYSYMNDTNVASYSTAAAVGMKRIESYEEAGEGRLYVYAITRQEWIDLTVVRVQKMEQYFNALLEMQAVDPSAVKTEPAAGMLRELLAYYENGLWLRDYEMDEAGLLPKDLKRGVLAQDAVFDFLQENIAE